jgi:hypothetical protein
MKKAWVTRSYIDKETREGVLFGSQVDLEDARFDELHAKGLVEVEEKLPKKLHKLFTGEKLSEKEKKETLKEVTTDPKISEVREASDAQVPVIEAEKDKAEKEASVQAEANQKAGKNRPKDILD